MKIEPKTVLQELRTRRIDPDSPAVREVVEEVAERVFRNFSPQADPPFPLAKPMASEA